MGMFDYNTATLSGAMDIIVAKDTNGKFRSTEFHFRVGKLKLLKSDRKKGWLWINNKDSGHDMYFSNSGVAYFEYEKEFVESDEEDFSGDGSPNIRDHNNRPKRTARAKVKSVGTKPD